MSKRSNRVLAALRASVSPPPIKKRGSDDHAADGKQRSLLTTAAVEAAETEIDDHLSYFSQHLSAAIRRPGSEPRLSIADFKRLFSQNQHDGGSHFVIHQRDHPIAGTHYDLRLQINKFSSVSWAIMYGLPGDPTSRRLNRNATETRVHCLWNHLIETGSARTGSLLIWDTGEYEILPYDQPEEQTDDESTQSSSGAFTNEDNMPLKSEPDKLHEAFQRGKIRLRLHGVRLPANYTIAIRLAPSQRQPKRKSSGGEPIRKRRRRRKEALIKRDTSESENEAHHEISEDLNRSQAHSDYQEDEIIRRNNAYTGSLNSIGSVHQRTWYLSLDRTSSGFEKRRGRSEARWERKRRQDELLGFEPFYVRGRDVERSVVTGRLGMDVLTDEGVVEYTSRNGWRPVLE